MVLPVSLDFYADETAIDFVARLAAANGFSSLRSFLGHTDVTATATVHGDADALSIVSGWSAVPVASLEKLSTRSSGVGRTWQMGQATLGKDALIEAAGAAPLPSRQPMLDRYLRERVFQDGGANFLDTLDVHVAAEFSRYLGDILVLHEVSEWMCDGTDLRE
jgi:hypothetical protein